MQLKHSLLYVLANAVPAAAAFITLAAYTRWIDAEAYGVYTTLLVIATSINIILFNWLYVGIMRYWNDQSLSVHSLQGAVIASLWVITALILVLTAVYALFSGEYARSLALATLLITGAFYTAYQRVNAITQQVTRYLLTEVARAVLTTGLGLLLVGYGYSWYGIILATSLGFVLVPLFSGHFWRHFWQYPLQLERGVLRELLRYGLPLSITFALLEIIHATDRVLLSFMAGFEAAGQYAVAFSLPTQLLIMLGSAVNMAAYPLIIQTLEQHGEQAARVRLADYLLVLLGISVPAWLGLVAIGGDFIPFLIGEAFAAQALTLLPWAGLTVLVNSLYLFHTSLAFQLAKQTGMTIRVVGIAAVLNLGLNLLLIPAYGLEGALLASLLAYTLCVVYGHRLGARYFLLPLPGWDIGKILLAAVGMFALLGSLPLGHGLWPGLGRIIVGIGSYAALVILLDIGGIKRYLANTFKPLQLNP